MARSRRFEGSFTVAADVETAFPLFSPLGEKTWVPGWAPELIHPPGVDWAEGLIFRTREETGDAVWVVTRLDRSAHAVEYHRVEPDRYVAHILIRCAAASERSTPVTVVYEFIGLSDRGNADIAAMSDAAYAGKMERWARAIAGAIGPARGTS